MKEVHPNEITFMKKEFERLEQTVNDGFGKNEKNLDSLRAEIRILSRSYVSREDLKEEKKEICTLIEKKSDRWVQKVVTGAIVMVLVAFFGIIINLTM